MALSQEFWLQQRRREAALAAQAAFSNAVAQGSLPATASASLAQSGLQKPLRPSALNYAGSANMIAGMPWVPPRKPDVPEPADAREHKEWNSDDEDIDEFGRKKRRVKSASSRITNQEKKQELKRDADAAETGKKGTKNALSAKQRAALERLRGRCKPSQVGGTDPGEDQVVLNHDIASLESNTAGAACSATQPMHLGMTWSSQGLHGVSATSSAGGCASLIAAAVWTSPASSLQDFAQCTSLMTMAGWPSIQAWTGLVPETVASQASSDTLPGWLPSALLPPAPSASQWAELEGRPGERTENDGVIRQLPVPVADGSHLTAPAGTTAGWIEGPHHNSGLTDINAVDMSSPDSCLPAAFRSAVVRARAVGMAAEPAPRRSRSRSPRTTY